MNDTFIIYKHTNLYNNKIYIGITKYGDNPQKRWRNGFGYYNNKAFFEDIVLYGWQQGFSHEILESNLSELDAITKEKEYIALYNSIEEGYNLSPGGNHPGEEGSIKISQKLIGIKRSNDSIKKQMETKKQRYGSNRGIHYLGTNSKKVRCKETGDIFASIEEAKRWCGSVKVGECCRGHRNFAGTHPSLGIKLSWEYAEDDAIVTINCEEQLKDKKQVYKIKCLETNIIYNNASHASKETGIQTCNILRVCKGERKTAGKKHWIFLKEE